MSGPPELGGLFDKGTNEAIRDALPDVVLPAFEYITHLGDGAALIGIAVFLYWFGAAKHRNNRAFVIAVGLVALSLSVGLKGLFEWPRPVTDFGPAEYGGFSFPSAHSMGAAAFYAAMAVEMKSGTKELRYAIAAVLIGLIGFSRLVLGVHFLGDVLVGIALGIAIVAVGVRFLERQPGALFALALVIAIIAFLLGSREFVQLSVGASLGGTVGWYLVRDLPGTSQGASILVLGLIPLPLLALTAVISGGSISGSALPLSGTLAFDVLVMLGYATATGIVLAIPHLATYLDEYPLVVKLQTQMPFQGREFKPDAAGEHTVDLGREERDNR